MTATDRAAALWIARTWAESDLDCDSRKMAVALLAAEAERERLAAEAIRLERLEEKLFAVEPKLRELHRQYGPPNTWIASAERSDRVAFTVTEWNRLDRLVRALAATTDTERHDG